MERMEGKKDKLKRKRTTLSRREVAEICNKIIFSKYLLGLEKNLHKLQKVGRQTEKEMQQQMHNMQTDASLSNLAERLSSIATGMDNLIDKVLVQDYILGRITKKELVESLTELHPNDSLSTAEHLEEIDQKKDAFEEYIKNVTK